MKDWLMIASIGAGIVAAAPAIVAAQAAPTLTPTVPLPNTPTAQINPVQQVPAQTICTQQYAPVCARISGVEMTYSNRCFAKAAGAEVVAEGPCLNSVVSPLPK
jgi:hypothetical protein